MNELFSTDQSSVVLSRFKTKIDGLTPQNDFETSRNSLIKLVTGSMGKDSKNWNKHCQINIDWIGDQFINRLSDDTRELDKERLDEICAMAFRFLLELYLSIKNDLSMEFESARRFVVNNIDLFEGSAKSQIEYALIEMPISILKQLSNSDAIDSIKDLNSTYANASELKKTWDNELLDKKNQVDKLKEALDKYKTAFNFVGLYQGFDDLSTEKKTELKNLVFWLRFLSILIVTPILIELLVIYANIKDIEAIKTGILISLFPTLSLVAISIYYFRVMLFNYKSIKSQLLQIDLRKTLCRFIQNYAEYSCEIKDKNSLSKFENIIFSGIVTDNGNLPSTYDGIEQIAKLIKSAKS